ncbi:MAG: protein translocase subunit SecD [Patescibacteria group bacterium]
MKKSTKVRLTVAMILIVAVVMGIFNWSVPFDRTMDYLNDKIGTAFPHFKNVPFHLGLDLQGGTHLVYEADTSKVDFGNKAESVEGVRDVIERRVNAFGVAEPLVQVNTAGSHYRVIVDLAGVSDVKEAIKMIGETPLLEFKEQNNEPQRALTNEEKRDLTNFNKEAKNKAEKVLRLAKKGDDFSTLAKENSELDGVAQNGGDLGWIGEMSAYNFIWQEANKVDVGTVIPKVLDDSSGYFVVKNNEKRENGQEISASHILICYGGAPNCQSTITKEEAFNKIKEIKEKVNETNFAELAKENSTDAGSGANGGDLGWFNEEQMVKPFSESAFALANGQISEPVETEFGYHLIYKKDERTKVEYKVLAIALKKKTEADILPSADPWKTTALTGKDLKKAWVEISQQTGAPEVSLEFNENGKTLFAEITQKNIGKPVAIFLDGQPISIPTVNEKIPDGKAVISGSFDIAEAKTLAQRLNAGALPVPINLISQQTVGASLGSDSLQKSLFAGLVGLLLVVIFMIIYYRLPGLLASIALFIYTMIVLFIFKAIPVTLSLSGISGFILSIGMAVDANVLIFERMKEELKLGKPLATAVSESIRRAWTAIRDGNYTTLIVCLVLALFGTGMIKGFAITLAIGVLTSMFSAMIITRYFLEIFIGNEKKERNLWWFGVKIKK